ncbi:hypothetical protein SEA_LINETTI_2 [Gordonia phage Linetti]|nr:hypothetical protein SEA_LINETTI_2 [Gordonia phage Linetti]
MSSMTQEELYHQLASFRLVSQSLRGEYNKAAHGREALEAIRERQPITIDTARKQMLDTSIEAYKVIENNLRQVIEDLDASTKGLNK